MNKLLTLLSAALVLASCGKELDVDTLNSNPFDPEYAGPEVFVFDTTYVQLVNIPGGVIAYHVICFHVKSELLPQGAGYSVRAERVGTGDVTLLNPDPPNSSSFKYLKVNPVAGVPECVRLSLFNNNSSARAEELCATL